ncbi:MAG: type II toxin-antitoxin system CcdA family antitoxin [Acidimicrobiaceae bacterium]|nr:type II toxin-antitoxin system CcdA family antitoxin [Acidimicrobiaceae bacterium]
MARVNVYLPDDLAAVARESGLNVSRLTQEALRRAIEARDLDLWLDEVAALPPTRIELAIIKDAVSEAKDELELGR